MTSANQEIARRSLEAWSRGSLEETLSAMDPEVEWHIAFRLPDLPPETKVVRGHDEVRELWSVFRSAWEEITVQIEEALYDADDVLVLAVRFRGLGAGSGVEVDRLLYYVQEIRDGKLVRIRSFDDQADARRAAGLER